MIIRKKQGGKNLMGIKNLYEGEDVMKVNKNTNMEVDNMKIKEITNMEERIMDNMRNAKETNVKIIKNMEDMIMENRMNNRMKENMITNRKSICIKRL